jgi:hypothetical protein
MNYFYDLHDTVIRDGEFGTTIGDDPNDRDITTNYFSGARPLTISGGNYTTLVRSPNLRLKKRIPKIV